jgi:DNA invertase Pin-like site-specific DNA recombinase
MIYGYCRTALENKHSIHKQMDAIDKYCRANNYEVEFYIDDGVSGFTLDRPEMNKLLSKAQEGDIIVVTDIAKLTRNMADYDYILNKGIKVVFTSLGV